MHYDVFISYRREGGFDTAALLCGRLKDAGYRVFFDVEALRSGRFNEALYAEIEKCQDFVVVLTPGCLDRCSDEGDWVRLEIAHALAHHRTVIPILTRGFAWPCTLPADIDALRYCNGVTASQEFFDATLKKMQTFLQSSLAVKQRRMMKYGLYAILAVGCSIAGIHVAGGRAGQRMPMSFPATQEERSLVKQLLYYVGTHLQVANEEYKIFDAFLKDTEAVTEPTKATLAQTKQSAEHTKAQLDVLVQRAKPLDSGTISALRKTLVPLDDVVALAAVPMNTSAEMRTALEMLCRVHDPSAPFDAQARKKLKAAYRTWNDASARALWYGMCELLLSIEATALEDFRQQWLPQFDFFQPSRGQWSRDRAECKSQQDLALQVLHGAVTDSASVLGTLSQRNVEMERQQKAAVDQLNATVTLCDTHYVHLLERVEAIMPDAISGEFLAVWTNQTVMVQEARVKHAARLVDRVSGELGTVLQARTAWGEQAIPLLIDCLDKGGGTSNQVRQAEVVQNSFRELTAYEQGLLDRLSAWRDARGTEAARRSFERIMIAKKTLVVKSKLARLALCRFAWEISHPLKERLSAAHGGFDAVSPETYIQMEKALADQWMACVNASAASLEQHQKQAGDLQQRLASTYERLAEKATVTDADAPGLIWNKAFILLRVGHKAEALDALVQFQKKQHAEDAQDSGVDRYVAAARAYIQQRYPDGYAGGALVIGFADNRKHSVLEVGDIVVSLDGQPVTTADEFVALKKARTGQSMTLRILRMEQNGVLFEQEVSSHPDDPLVGVASLKYVLD